MSPLDLNTTYKLKISVLLLFQFLFINAHSQLFDMDVFHNISVNQGLNNSVVYDMIQDEEGYMWFATKEGLNKFDGSNIRSYFPTTHTPHLLGDNNVHSLAKSPDGVIFCGTSTGNIYSYDNDRDTFLRVNIKGINPIKSVINNLIFYDNTLFICSANGLYALNILSGTIANVGNIYNIVNCAFVDSSGMLWVGTDKQLFIGKISIDSTNVSANLKIVEEFTEKTVISIHEDAEHKIWLGTIINGLFIVEDNAITDLSSKLLDRYGSLVSVRDIVTTPDNKIMVGLDGVGICVFDNNLNIESSFSHVEDIPSSLSSNGVYSIFYDHEDILWVSTFGGGVNMYYKNKYGFVKINHKANNHNSLKSNSASAFLETKDGMLWFGTKKGISILNPQTGNWKHVGLNKPGEEEKLVQSIIQLANGSVLAGTYGDGLFNIDPSDLSFTKVIGRNELGKPMELKFIYSIALDHLGRIWQGGIRDSLTIYNPGNGIVQKVNAKNVTTICESSWGTFYVGTTPGLFEVDPTTLKIKRPEPANVLLNQSRIFCIFQDQDTIKAILWLGTEGDGLIRWDLDTKKIEIFTSADGLASNLIYGIVHDNQGNLWLSTSDGLTKFNSEKEEFTNYSYSDGLSDQEFNFGAYGRTSSGNLVFGGQNGFTFFTPSNHQVSNALPKVVFNSFKLFGKEQLPDEEGSPLLKHINSSSAIQLSHRQSSVSFGFAAINFSNPQKIKYQWMLEGFDKSWTMPSPKTEAVYTNLKPGSYTFKVKASNPDGVWGDNLKSIDLIIEPPFWATVWAYLLYAIGIIGILIAILQFYRIRLNEKNAIEKNRFFINIAHDLRTPLTLIKAPLEQLDNLQGLSQKDVGSLLLARKNVDRLTRLITQIMDFQKADLRKMQFSPAPYNFNEFVKETVSSFLPLLSEKKITIEYDFQKDFEFWFDRNMMEKIIFNLFSNAIKYTSNNGKIYVTISKEKEQCDFVIKDTGIGIPLKQQKEIFSRYFRAENAVNSSNTGSGVGLLLVEKLVELHDGTIRFESQENVGSTFFVKFPIKKYDPRIIPTVNLEKIETPQNFKRQRISLSDKAEDFKKYRLLIVEDNPELLDFIVDFLNDKFEITTAFNGKEGLDRIKEKSPDLIISDIMMPVMDGNQFCNTIKNNLSTCHIPVILLTALNTLEHRIEGLNVGADSYIEKPFDINHLHAQIQNLLITRQKLKEKYVLHTSVTEKDMTFNNLDAEFLNKAKKYVLDNIDNNLLSVEMLAKFMAMSRPVLYRKLKALTDQSPQDYIRLIRLQEAKKLLKQHDKPISEIAYITGFSDPKYFSTSFKKLFGCTPTEFIEKEN